MSVAVVPVEVRKDGKAYPLGGYLRGRDRWRAVNLAHQLHCRDGLSYRQTQAGLEDHGIRRSLGQIHSDLRRYVCAECSSHG